MSPDYEALSPALSSPGPSISERGGQNSPPRFKTQIVQQANIVQQQPQKITITAAKNKRNSAGNVKKAPPKVIVEKIQSEYDGLMFNKDQFNSTGQQNKEVKIYRMAPSKSGTVQTVNYVTANGNASKKVTLQLKNNSNAGMKTTNAVILNNNNIVMSPNNGNGNNNNTVRKMIRVQQPQNQQNGRSILLPVSIQDIKDFRTIKIVNSSNLKNKSANIKLAAANLLQQSKQGLVQKNVVFSKEQIMADDSMSDVTQNSDCESYVFEDIMQQSSSVIDAVERQRHNSGSSDIEHDGDDDDNVSDDGDCNANNGSYQKLVLTTEEKRLLSKEGITLPTNYPLTKHEERELKRIRRKIRNKISAQDSRKRKKEYVDGLEERVKQCTDENQSLLKRIKILQNQNHDLMSQMKKIQTLLTKGTGKSTQPATCLMVLLLSMALVAVPNLKLGGPSQQQNIQDSIELAEIMQESSAQNRRSLLFDTKEQLGDALVDEEVNFEDIMSFNVNTLIANEHDYSEDVHFSEPKAKKARMFVDYDIDEEVWNDKSRSRIKQEGNDNAVFKREEESLLKNMQSSGFNIKQEIIVEDSNVILDKDILDLVSKRNGDLYEINLDTFSSITNKDVNNIEIISFNNQQLSATTTNNKLNSSQQIQQQHNQKKLIL